MKYCLHNMKGGVRTILLFLLCLSTSAVWADVEPNDDFATATPLDLGVQITGDLGTEPAGDANDYYAIELPNNGQVTVTASYEEGLTGFLYIYRSSGSQITFGSAGPSATLSADCVGEGLIYVRAARSGSSSGEYTLQVDLNALTLPEDPEPNNTFAQITETYQEGEVFTGHLGYTGEETGNSTDTEDWFEVIASENGDVTLNVEYEGTLAGFIYLYRKTGIQLSFVGAAVGANSLTVNCLDGDTLVVRITRNGGCGQYSGSISVAGLSLAEDNEPNNTFQQITDTYDTGETFTGHLGYFNAIDGTDSEDWFEVVLNEDGQAQLTISPNNTLGGFIYFYSKTGVQQGFIGYGDETESVLTLNCFAQDTVVVRVSSNAGCGDYSCVVNVNAADLPADAEPNNTFATRQETFDANEEFTGRLGYFDADEGTDSEDWFEVVMDDDGTVDFTITPTGTLGGFIYTYTKDGVQRGFIAYGGEEPSTLSIDCLAGDNIVVRVSRNAGCGSYTGVVDVLPPPLPGDAEPNNVFADIQETFDVDEEFTGRLGYLDADTGTDSEDWFEVVIDNDGAATLNMLSDGNLGGFIYLYSKAGVQYSFQAYAAGEAATLTIPCLAADTIVARINRNGGCGSYTASVNVTPNIYDNDPEPNNTQAQAITTNGGVVNEGHIGYLDTDTGTDSEDWYTFQINQVPFEVEAELQTVGTAAGFIYFYNGAGSVQTFVAYSEGQTIMPFTFTQTGTYAVRISNSSGCGQYQLNKLCGTDPEVSIDEGDQSVCPGDEATFTATAGFAEYQWVKDAVIVGTDQSLVTAETGTYFVRGIDGNGCVGVSEEVSLSNFVVPELVASASGSTSICEGESITLEATPGFASYLWSNGESTQSIEVTAEGDYSVSASTADGCPAESNELTIDVSDVPSLSIVADGDTEICAGFTVTLSANDAFESYLWSDGQTGSSIEVDETGTYFATGTTIDGCESISNSIEVTVFDDEGPCVIDCAGVAGGSSTEDECGVCDDDPSNDNETCTDCAGVVNGEAFLDNCGACVGGNTGQEPCEDDCFGVPGGNGVVDECGVCREADDPDFNSTCLDCANVPNGASTLDECGVCDDDPSNDNETCTDCAGVVNGSATVDECGVCDDNPENDNESCADCAGVPNGPNTEDDCGVCDNDPTNDGLTCLDCTGVPNGGATVDDCGVCDTNPDNDNQTCADCEGVPNGDALPGTVCVVDGVAGTYGENCNCIPNEDCDYVYFLASQNESGGSDVYRFYASNDDTDADLELLISLDEEVSLAYDEDNELLYMLEEDEAAFSILDLNALNVPPSSVITQYSVTGFTGSAFFNGTFYCMSEDLNRVYSYDPFAGMGVVFSGANVGGGDLAFAENGVMYMVTSGPNKIFQVISGSQNVNLGSVPPGSSGLAFRGDGNFFLAVDGRNRLFVGTPQADDTGQRLRLFLNDQHFYVQNGDLASGCGSGVDIAAVQQSNDPELSELKLEIMPNPTEGTAFATFSTSEEENATLEVYDMSGRRVAMLFNGTMSPNVEYRAEFDGSGLPNGVYIYRYTTGRQVEMEKLIIAR